jgi:transposase
MSVDSSTLGPTIRKDPFMSKTLKMSAKELDRSHVLRLLLTGAIIMSEAVDHLGLSERQCYRLKARYKAEGDAGLVHRLRDGPSNHRYPEECRQPILDLYRTRYSDYGPTLFSEVLERDLGYVLDAETLRRWLIKADLWQQERNRSRHRKKRPRRATIGALVQIDGSHHDWFEGRGPWCCLFVFIDDASNRTYFRFAASENIHDALIALRRYVERFGIFEQAYTDKKNIYLNAGKQCPFTRVMGHLRIEMIYANSPQAKGRVERANRTHQDRLVKALRERNISTIEDANRFLDEEYLDAHNARFSHTDGLIDVHRPVADLDLDNLICIEDERCVYHDMTFQYHAVFYQIHAGQNDLPLPRQNVLVRHWLDGTLHAFWRQHELVITACEERPAKKSPAVPHPADNHPWRRAIPIGKAKRMTITELCKQHR